MTFKTKLDVLKIKKLKAEKWSKKQIQQPPSPYKGLFLNKPLFDIYGSNV